MRYSIGPHLQHRRGAGLQGKRVSSLEEKFQRKIQKRPLFLRHLSSSIVAPSISEQHLQLRGFSELQPIQH